MRKWGFHGKQGGFCVSAQRHVEVSKKQKG